MYRIIQVKKLDPFFNYRYSYRFSSCFNFVLLLKISYNIGQQDVWTILTAHTREDNKNNHSVHSLN